MNYIIIGWAGEGGHDQDQDDQAGALDRHDENIVLICALEFHT